MLPWCNPFTEIQRPDDTFRIGDVVYSGASRGTVVTVDASENAMGIIWDDSGDRYGEITYPIDASYLRRAMPWEL